jgi:hypothetical protein
MQPLAPLVFHESVALPDEVLEASVTEVGNTLTLTGSGQMAEAGLPRMRVLMV